MDKSLHMSDSRDPNAMNANLEQTLIRQTFVNIPSEPTLTPANENAGQIHIDMPQPPPKYVTTQPQPMQLPEYTTTKFQPVKHPNSSISTPSVKLSLDEPPAKFCKICHESEVIEEEEGGGPYIKDKLISPCKCKGSLQYVHIGCLNQWRASSTRKDSSYQCEVCKYEYKFYRQKLAIIISNPIFLHLVTFIMFLIIIFIVSWIVKLIDNKGRLVNNNDKLWTNKSILGLKVIYFIFGICIISILSLFYMMIYSCRKGFVDTRDSYCYCGGCGLFMPWDLGCSCSDSGECNIIILVLSVIMLSIIILIGIIGVLSAGYLLIQKYTNIYLDGLKEKILEVEKES
ncbi:8008_t:CDS:1 [Dentiscutata erythropus]|uniref:8008_t:CDS:1 n=1 Tax=Dentiscutata erythropus TaxID=1348616 RepID=A0A9N9JQI6_9GLOM|nr:8008_t:CDS:1 [Dentiscutata erythropus]